MITLRPDWILTAEGLRADWCVSIESGTIVGIAPAERHPEITEALPGVILVPGFVNAHSHAFQRAFRGHVQWKDRGQDDFWSWRELMYRTANGLPPEGVYAVSRLAFLEMAEAGVTQVGEFHYLHHQADGTPYADRDELAHQVINAALDVGIRICLLRVAYERAGPGKPPGPLQRRFVDPSPDFVLNSVERLTQFADSRVSAGLAPHSIRAVGRDWLQEFSGYAGPIHMHVSEQPAENALSEQVYGCSPLSFIGANGILSERFSAVHMTHPVAGDLELLEETGSRICVCPTTELDLGDGFLPSDLRERVPLCVGSDSQAVIDMMAESRALEMHGRGVAGRRNVLAPVGEKHGLALRLMNAATQEGDRALGGAGQGITVGAPADLIGLNLDRPAAFGMPPVEAVVFASRPEWVTDVWVAGSRVVEQGRHPKREEILQRSRQWLPE